MNGSQGSAGMQESNHMQLADLACAVRKRLNRAYSLLSSSIKGCHREASQLVESRHHWNLLGTGKHCGGLHTIASKNATVPLLHVNTFLMHNVKQETWHKL